MTEPVFRRMALIGMGLIGSSLSLAARRGGLVGSVVGCARTQATRDTALRLGLAEAMHESPADAVRDADLVILCTPVGASGAVAEAMAPVLAEGAVVSDVGSVKQAVVRDVAPHIPAGVHFVPGHPVAGSEHSGPEAGFADLFEDRWCILTPLAGVDPAAVNRLKSLWKGLGSKVELMTPDHHDRVLAITSHLPHLIAYSMVGTVFDLEAELRALDEQAGIDVIDRREVVKFSAGGFRDFTRIAGSDPVMWRDVFLSNKEPVLEMLGRFTEDLLALQRAIRWSDGEMLKDLFTRTREIRRGVIEAGQAGRFDPREHDPGEPESLGPMSRPYESG
ncbi:MAG: prephenate/arogenate dehydrogenase family protein [Alphaproteobacteria bacterium]|nr:prephenate/arogenate dehydrogenase family protein [Alphaproteobacteria bacterium]